MGKPSSINSSGQNTKPLGEHEQEKTMNNVGLKDLFNIPELTNNAVNLTKVGIVRFFAPARRKEKTDMMMGTLKMAKEFILESCWYGMTPEEIVDDVHEQWPELGFIGISITENKRILVLEVIE